MEPEIRTMKTISKILRQELTYHLKNKDTDLLKDLSQCEKACVPSDVMKDLHGMYQLFTRLRSELAFGSDRPFNVWDVEVHQVYFELRMQSRLYIRQALRKGGEK